MKKNRSKAAHHAFLQRVDAEYREKLAKKAERRKEKKEGKMDATMDVDAVVVDDGDIDLTGGHVMKGRRPLSTRDKMAKRRRERRDRLKIRVVHGGDAAMRDDDKKKSKKSKRKPLAIKKDITKANPLNSSFATVVVSKARALVKAAEESSEGEGRDAMITEWKGIHENFSQHYLSAPTPQLGAFLALLHSAYSMSDSNELRRVVGNTETVHKLLGRLVTREEGAVSIEDLGSSEVASLLYFSLPFVKGDLSLYEWWRDVCYRRLLNLLKASQGTPQAVTWSIRSVGHMRSCCESPASDEEEELWRSLLHMLAQHKEAFNSDKIMESLRGIEEGYCAASPLKGMVEVTLRSLSTRIEDIADTAGGMAADDAAAVLRVWAKCRVCDEKLILFMSGTIRNSITTTRKAEHGTGLSPEAMVNAMYGLVKFHQQYDGGKKQGSYGMIDLLAVHARRKMKDFTLEQIAQFCSSLAKSRITNKVIATMAADRVVLETTTTTPFRTHNCYINTQALRGDAAVGLSALPLYRVVNLYVAFGRFGHNSGRFWCVMDDEVMRRYNSGTLLTESRGKVTDLIELLSAHAAVASSAQGGAPQPSPEQDGYHGSGTGYTRSVGNIPPPTPSSTLCAALTATILSITHRESSEAQLLSPREALAYLVAVGKVGYRDTTAVELCLSSLRAPSSATMPPLPAFASLTLTQHMQLDSALMRLGVECNDLSDFLKGLLPKASEAGSLTKEESRGAWTTAANRGMM
ncbi:hypothetical protein FOZ62_010789 [Perkinsus olseni]|uniref:Uncharacterized protein n=1 Tax=Perkinsus olseni TaxID=32597 RepID=A0A7J6TV19_PEROL|nr:hypothetical protein FOZ62_010789 [Perkinsus olseni]